MVLRKENDEFENIEKDSSNLDENNTTINTNIDHKKKNNNSNNIYDI